MRNEALSLTPPAHSSPGPLHPWLPLPSLFLPVALLTGDLVPKELVSLSCLLHLLSLGHSKSTGTGFLASSEPHPAGWEWVKITLF